VGARAAVTRALRLGLIAASAVQCHGLMTIPFHSMAMRSAILGAALSFGMPAGWLVFRLAQGDRLAAQLREDPVLFGYMLLGPLVAVSLFGWFLGRRDDRLLDARETLRGENQELARLATVDGLTQLYNQRAFHDRLREELARASRTGQKLALLWLDLDHFKGVNDTWGHLRGDAVLRHVASLIQGHARGSDPCFRVGGEEFAVICPGVGLRDAEGVAERIRNAAASHPLFTSDGPVVVTVSIGVATSAPGDTEEQLLQRADRALYEAKAGGRNRVVSCELTARAAEVGREVQASQSRA
jgi:diguanylate cyclase (GGDEF)-like protein